MGVMLGIFKAQIPLGSSRHDTSDVSSESSSSCRTCRAVLLDKLDTAKMHGLDTSNVSRRVETWRAEWNLGLTMIHPTQ